MSKLTTRTLWETISTAGKADFLVQPAVTYSYAALEQAIRQWLAVFDQHDLQPGDRIVIRTASEEVAIAALLAAILDGLTPILLAADTSALRMHALARTTCTSLLIMDQDRETDAAVMAIPAAFVSAGKDRAQQGAFWQRKSAVMLPGLDCAAATRAPRLPLDEVGLAYILFTSGTTAAPTGVRISRGNLFANLATLSRVFGYDRRSRIFNDMILAHADGLIQGPLLAVANGCALIRSGGFQLGRMEQWLARVRSTRSTHVITVPTVWSMIDSYAKHDDYFDAAECRALLSVAAKLSDDLWSRLETRFQRPVFNQYGLTETCASALYAGPHPEMGTVGTIGRPIDCEARIDPGSETADGELHLRGDNIFHGYWCDDARTAQSFTADGWLKTGDLARRRDDGSYDILGRLKAVIMSGGVLIRPDEIDEVMMLHPRVVESVTVGIADPVFDETPVTVVVVDGVISEIELAAHASENLEAQKTPKRILQVPAIPRGGAGKANLATVRALVRDALSGLSQPQDASDVQAIVIATAADIFRVDPALLSAKSRQDDVKGWDSFSQLSLLLAVEQALDIRIPASRIAAIERLGDIIATAEELRR